MSLYALQREFDNVSEEDVEKILAEALFEFLKGQESEVKKDGG